MHLSAESTLCSIWDGFPILITGIILCGLSAADCKVATSNLSLMRYRYTY